MATVLETQSPNNVKPITAKKNKLYYTHAPSHHLNFFTKAVKYILLGHQYMFTKLPLEQGLICHSPFQSPINQRKDSQDLVFSLPSLKSLPVSITKEMSPHALSHLRLPVLFGMNNLVSYSPIQHPKNIGNNIY